MALYELTEFASYVQSDVDTATSVLLRDLVTGLINDLAGAPFDPVPARVKAIALESAKRAYVNPQGLSSETVGSYSYRRDSRAPGVYLDDQEQADILAATRTTPRRPLWTQPTTRSENVDGTIYVPTGPPPSGYPFPWYADDEYL